MYVLSAPKRTTFATDSICIGIWHIDVHRLGRTARAGKEGLGLLVLDPMELPFIASKGMKELPLQEISEDELLGQPGANAWETKIEQATESVDPDVRAGSYRVSRIYPTKLNMKSLCSLNRRGLVSISLPCVYCESRTIWTSCAPQMRTARRFYDTVYKPTYRVSQPSNGRRWGKWA